VNCWVVPIIIGRRECKGRLLEDYFLTFSPNMVVGLGKWESAGDVLFPGTK
jgi:hypothetical protein